MSLLFHAAEQEKEQAAWEVWVQVYPHFTEESFKSFSDFKKEAFKNNNNTTNLSYAEIRDEMEELISKHKMKGG